MKRIILCLLLLPLLMAGGIYKWTDENGKVHFGDRPVDMNKAETVKIRKQQTGTMVSKAQTNKYKKSIASNSQTDLQKAEAKYKKVRAGFYETESPSSSCRYAVDLQDEMKITMAGVKKPKRKIYLCPNE